MRHTLNSLKKHSKNTRTLQHEADIHELEVRMQDNAKIQRDLLRDCLSKIAENINKRDFKFTLIKIVRKRFLASYPYQLLILLYYLAMVQHSYDDHTYF